MVCYVEIYMKLTKNYNRFTTTQNKYKHDLAFIIFYAEVKIYNYGCMCFR